MGENRRNPYQAVVTVGKKENGNPNRKSLGCKETYNEAYQLLLEYGNTPYDIDSSRLTFNEIFNKIEPQMRIDMENNKKGMSKSNYKSIISTYKNHFSSISNKNPLQMKKRDLQKIIDDSGLAHTGQGYIQNIFVRIYSYIIDYLEIPMSKNPSDNLKITSKEKSCLHKPFNIETIMKLWNLWNKDKNFYVSLILIYLYTGLRPTELLIIEKEKVFLNENYMIGGMKTDAGINRYIPIHPKIKPIIEYFYYNYNQKYLIVNPSTNNSLSYSWYKKKFISTMKKIGYDHTPHDTRHTFATYCKICGISDSNIKLLMGHSTKSDVTINVYTHLGYNYLYEEILKLKYENME